MMVTGIKTYSHNRPACQRQPSVPPAAGSVTVSTLLPSAPSVKVWPPYSYVQAQIVSILLRDNSIGCLECLPSMLRRGSKIDFVMPGIHRIDRALLKTLREVQQVENDKTPTFEMLFDRPPILLQHVNGLPSRNQ